MLPALQGLTMNYYKTTKNAGFVGRTYWLQRLERIDKKNEASVIVIYGRRRVGKTELIEQFFHGRNILKFEGIQPNRKVRANSKEEQKKQISEYTGQLYPERQIPKKGIQGEALLCSLTTWNLLDSSQNIDRSMPNKTLPAWPVIAYQMNTCIFISNSSNPKFKLLIADNI